MADSFTIYKPSPLAYIGFGISEGLRKHVERMQAEQDAARRNALAQQELNQRMQMAQMSAMAQANDLAEKEREFNEASAKDAARLDFEKEKFKEEKRQFRMEYPVKKAYYEGLVSAKETTAEAAQTRATKYQPPGAGKINQAYTPAGLGKQYSDIWNRQFKEAADTYGKDFTNIYTDENLYNEVSQKATDQTRKAMTPFLNAYNAYVDSNPTAASMGATHMNWDDLEATPTVRAGKQDNVVASKAAKSYNDLKNDREFPTRFNALKLTNQEIDLLRTFAPDLYKVYIGKLGKGGGKALQDQLDYDEQQKQDAIRLQKNQDKR